ncbi:DUF4258 domain-containing protein [Candidatus Peregrinibacteria bacterium]|nr:DUF4258 domain-containing protein [Candidatus Peregrinibacteria bacterium]
MDLNWIKRKIKGEYEFSCHADRERESEKLKVEDVEMAIISGEIIEDYPSDPRGASCLVLGYGSHGNSLHVVCGKTPAGNLRIITVYTPSLPRWLDPKTRRK